MLAIPSRCRTAFVALPRRWSVSLTRLTVWPD